MNFSEFQNQIDQYLTAGKTIFATSSFQSHSIPLLHMISRLTRPVPVAFINTGFHFPETLMFRDDIRKRFQLEVLDVRSTVPRIHQRDTNGQLYFTSDTDRCCYLNKIQPMEPLLREFDVWINGIRADQSEHRRQMQIEQPAPHNCTRFHPMLDWDDERIDAYCLQHDLPRHPLENQGYFSIGCEPCTIKNDSGDGRDGRWQGQSRTECGLHTVLARIREMEARGEDPGAGKEPG